MLIISLSLLPQITKLLEFFLPLVTDLRLENAGMEDLDKLLINTLFEVAFLLVENICVVFCFH